MALSPLIKQLARRTGPLFFIALAAWLVRLLVPFPPAYAPRITTTLHVIAVLALFLQTVRWANTFVAYWTRVYIDRHQLSAGDASTVGAMAILVRIAFFAILLLLALETLNVQVTGLITGLGIGGIAVAFALQNVLADLFGALSIVFDKPFVVGDAIQVDSFSGTVTRIGLKSTRVRSDEGEEIIFSNGELLKGRIRNFGRMQQRRVIFLTRVDRQTIAPHLEQIPTILHDIIDAQPYTRFGRSHLKGVGDTGSIDFETVYYLTTPAYVTLMDTQQAVLLAMLARFNAEGIKLAHTVPA